MSGATISRPGRCGLYRDDPRSIVLLLRMLEQDIRRERAGAANTCSPLMNQYRVCASGTSKPDTCFISVNLVHTESMALTLRRGCVYALTLNPR